jgi:hypothetical protein
MILGAYKATNIPILEHEVQIPPVDSLLEGTIMKLQERQAMNKTDDIIQRQRNRILNRLPTRTQRSLKNKQLTSYSRLVRWSKDLANEHRGPEGNELSLTHFQQAALDRQKNKWSQRWEDFRTSRSRPSPATDNEETGKEILKLRSRLSRRETTYSH